MATTVYAGSKLTHLCHNRRNKRLDQVALRGQTKVDTQWKLNTVFHNLVTLSSHEINGLLAQRGFPKFDFVALRIDDPAELSVFRFLGLVEQIAALLSQLENERVQVCVASATVKAATTIG